MLHYPARRQKSNDGKHFILTFTVIFFAGRVYIYARRLKRTTGNMLRSPAPEINK